MNDQSKTVLIAEDGKFLAKLYTTKLTEKGFNVTIACDGEEAIEKLTSGEKPDILLLDLIMPKKSGFEVLTEIKKDPNLSSIPIIILSNLGQDEDVKKGIDAGANDYVIKANISIDELVGKIEKLTSIPTQEVPPPASTTPPAPAPTTMPLPTTPTATPTTPPTPPSATPPAPTPPSPTTPPAPPTPGSST